MVSILINGIYGRMGRQVATLAWQDDDVRLVGGLEEPNHAGAGSDVGEMLGFGKSGIQLYGSIPPSLSQVILIDFSTPTATIELLKATGKKVKGIVIGTTGLTESDMECMQEIAQHCAILYSPNMSLGVNFLFYLTQITAEKLGKDFDIEIIEAHHRYKKDSPSGTAKKLGKIVSEAISTSYKSAIKNGRVGINGDRKKNEIGMHAVRGGDIVGDHTVLFAGNGERLELKHSAQSRATFAQGAIQGAKWLHTKVPGLYTMRDLLGF